MDTSVEFIRDQTSVAPEKPFFLYLAFGAAHAPHQTPPDFIARNEGRFDHGWDRERELVLKRQLDANIVPAGTSLPPRNDDVPEWESLSSDQRRLYTRMQEVFSGFMEHTDAAVARVLACLDRHEIADDTAVFLLSDNGASGEGGPSGSVNEYRYFMALDDSLEDNLSAIDELGGPWAHNHYPSGWAAAGNTPLRWYKRFNHGGGVRAPLAVRWPRSVSERGEIRRQFLHVVDLAPTVLEVAGVSPAQEYDGVRQMPIDGRSFAATFRDAEAPSQRHTQYFEMAGSRAIYHEGWKAVTRHEEGQRYDDEHWELYDLDADFNETRDLSVTEPERLAELQGLWWEHARKNGVLPLDDRLQSRALDRGPQAHRSSFRLDPGSRLFTGVAGPNWANRSFTLDVDLALPHGTEDGVLLAFGRRAAGFVLFVQNRRVVFEYNRAGDRQTLESKITLNPGAHQVQLDVHHIDLGEAEVGLLIDDAATDRLSLRTMVGGFGTLSTQVGHNSPSPVSGRFESPYTFRGVLDPIKVEFHDNHLDGPSHDLQDE